MYSERVRDWTVAREMGGMGREGRGLGTAD